MTPWRRQYSSQQPARLCSFNRHMAAHTLQSSTEQLRPITLLPDCASFVVCSQPASPAAAAAAPAAATPAPVSAVTAAVVSAPAGAAPSTWKVADVAGWLESIELGMHSESFKTHSVNGKMLLALSDQDLYATLGVVSPLHRKKLLMEISALRKSYLS